MASPEGENRPKVRPQQGKHFGGGRETSLFDLSQGTEEPLNESPLPIDQLAINIKELAGIAERNRRMLGIRRKRRS